MMRIFKNFFPEYFSINQPKKRIYEEKWIKKFQKFLLIKFQFFSKRIFFVIFLTGKQSADIK